MSIQITGTPDRLPFWMRHPIRWVAHGAICSVFLHHGLMSLLDFNGAIAEMERFGLLPAAPIAACVIVIQILCSILVLSGFLRWIGALILCVFTIVSTLLALPFWSMQPGAERLVAANAFMANIGVAGGLLLIAWYDLHLWRTRRSDD